jgi:hypothetical protein
MKPDQAVRISYRCPKIYENLYSKIVPYGKEGSPVFGCPPFSADKI